ncbi:GNAT family N-acetyltransferase [Mobilitalea sibirica]|nr:GNAT family N-acetyltransferase [Mobilitalea sibirica]
MYIQEIDEKYRDAVNKILKEEWICPPSISRGRIIDTTILPGFLFIEDKVIKGVVTYHIENEECEIVTLNSFEENRGIGSALIKEVLDMAKKNNCQRLWLITTNDDIKAIRFYQKKGFDLKAAHINAIEVSRKLKPSIPLIGMDDIPIKHEMEFEIALRQEE